MKKLYYVIEKQTENDLGDDEVSTGRKIVTIYTIENNEPKRWFDIDICIDECTIDMIAEYLGEYMKIDEEFKMIQL